MTTKSKAELTEMNTCELMEIEKDLTEKLRKIKLIDKILELQKQIQNET